MAPTIRIDEEVWQWLKAKARPLEDTPNTVLRRLAGFPVAGADADESWRHGQHNGRRRDSPRQESSGRQARAVKRVSGRLLNRIHSLGARHALYHKDGTFYECLAEFPGVLCDSTGFVRYDSKDQFQADHRLHIGQKVNVPAGLASHPRHRRFVV